MPIIASAKKQLRQNKKRKARNDNFRELYREARVAFEKAIKENNVEAAKNILVNQKDSDGKTTKAGLQSIIDKLVKKNIIHKNNGARKKAKFVKMLKAIS
ncbi:30S ribosomal protein S20 [Candidatus Gracilibacteria bacterium]|nr:MAG: 30S ribosomal protein S20 [Candidatus Gracilibacteria bacterium]